MSLLLLLQRSAVVVRYFFEPPVHAPLVHPDGRGLVKKWVHGEYREVPASDVEMRFIRHFTPTTTRKTVLRVGAVYQAVDYPSSALLETADQIRVPDGTVGPAVFRGGYRAEVTESIAAELEAAGYTVEEVEV